MDGLSAERSRQPDGKRKVKATVNKAILIENKLQRVLNAAARVNTGTRKFDRGLTHILHNELHWLDIPQRVVFKLCTTVYKCLHGLVLQYLEELCVSVADVPSRRRLRLCFPWSSELPSL